MNIQENNKTTGNVVMGTLAGLLACIVGATIYALYPFIFGVQLSLLAIGVGGLVGFAVHSFGKGRKPLFGIIGAFLALVSCITGDIISVIAIYSYKNSAPFFEILVGLNFHSIIDILSQLTDFINIMFYGLAMVIAYAASTMPPLPTYPIKNDGHH